MPAQKLKYLVIHCTATPQGRDVTGDEIERWHTDPLECNDKFTYKGKQYDATKSTKYIYKGKVYDAVELLPEEVRSARRRGRGWSQYGYSDLVHLNGLIENLVPYNNDNLVDPWEITNGATGINSISRHIVYAGGTDKIGAAKDTRTSLQTIALINYIRQMLAQHPDIKIAGHNQFANKACPSFNVPKWLRQIGITEKNIYQP